MVLRKFVAALLVGAGCIASAHAASDYPSKTVRIIVTFAPGGVADMTGRVLASELSEELGQTVIVENQAGASGAIGTAFVARSEPDGYTLLLGTNATLAVNPATFNNLAYDPVNDFAPISLIANQPLVIGVSPKVPAQSLSELVDLARSKPGALSYGSAGSSMHLAAELFAHVAGIELLHVPYKGSSPAITDLIGGQIDLMFDPMVTLYPQVKAGRVRGLAVTTTERSPAAPELPTAVESGFTEYNVGSWQSFAAPAGTPPEVIERLHTALDKVLRSERVRNRLAESGMVSWPTTPEEASKFIESEIARWKEVAQRVSVQAQ